MSVEKMCKVLEVSRNAFVNWRKNRTQQRREHKNKLIGEIKNIYKLSFGSYGSPRIHLALKQKNIMASRPLVARIMKQEGIKSKIRMRYVVTTDSKHNNPIASNVLNRQFRPTELGKVWVSDITYIKVNQDWAYLTTMIDLADRKVVGWSISTDMTTENTVIAAWNKARMNRDIQPGFILHSDRGVQYCSKAFQDILNNNKLVTQSMSRKGNCWDNAVAESFFKTIKYECLNQYKFNTLKELKQVAFDYIERWYNRQRMHSALNYKTPLEKEIELTSKLKNVA